MPGKINIKVGHKVNSYYIRAAKLHFMKGTGTSATFNYKVASR